MSGTGIFGADDPAAAARAIRAGRHAVMTLAAKVLTVSDGVAGGTRDDASGRALVEALTAAGYDGRRRTGSRATASTRSPTRSSS